MRILATDIDTNVLAQAQSATYPIESLEGIPGERRRASFLRGYGEYEGQVQVRPELRRMVDFRRINLNRPEWGSSWRFNAIFCRNVIIYFERSLQREIVTAFAARLKERGYLSWEIRKTCTTSGAR